MKRTIAAITAVLVLASVGVGFAAADVPTERTLKAFNVEVDMVVIEYDQGAGWIEVPGLVFESFRVDNVFGFLVKPNIPFTVQATWTLGNDSGSCVGGPFKETVDVVCGGIE